MTVAGAREGSNSGLNVCLVSTICVSLEATCTGIYSGG